jgi:type VI secretion system secreted protein VgrG
MARHHVISTTACDVFFKLVAHQKKSLGARFDSMIVTFSADGQPVLGATLRNATSGCELHRLAGQPDECWCCGYDEQLEFVSHNKVPLAHADYRLTLNGGCRSYLVQWRALL